MAANAVGTQAKVVASSRKPPKHRQMQCLRHEGSGNTRQGRWLTIDRVHVRDVPGGSKKAVEGQGKGSLSLAFKREMNERPSKPRKGSARPMRSSEKSRKCGGKAVEGHEKAMNRQFKGNGKAVKGNKARERVVKIPRNAAKISERAVKMPRKGSKGAAKGR